jgi:hypothetical protein
MKVVDLPLSVFGLIRDFISLSNHVPGRHDILNWIRFCNICNSAALKDVKRNFIFYYLNTDYSLAYMRYFTEKSLCDDVDSVLCIVNNVSSTRNQITLDLSECSYEELNDEFFLSHLSFFQSLHGLKLPVCLPISNKTLDVLKDLYFLHLSFCGIITDLTILKNVKVLCLPGCSSLQNHNALENCLYVFVSNCTISDLSNLTHVKRLCMMSVNYIPTEIPLMFNRSLSFSACETLVLTNPSNLGNVYELDLEECVNIQDLSGFHSVVKLNIRGIKNISKGLPSNNKLKVLMVEGVAVEYLGIHYFSQSQKEMMNLKIYSEVPDVSYLQGFETVSFCQIEKETVVSGLLFLKNLTLIDCPGINFVSRLPFVNKLTMERCNTVVDFLTLPVISEFSVERCYETLEFVVEINSTSLKWLKLVNCTLKELQLYCDTLQSLFICNKNLHEMNRCFPIHLHGAEIKELFLSLPHPIIQYSCEKNYSFVLNNKHCDTVGGHLAL